MKLPFAQIDAFADKAFAGNSAAVMPLDAWLPDDLLQAIAMENNLSETAFTVPADGGDADYDLRWFTPTMEVAMCGHATLASGHHLIGARDAVRFRTRKAGVLTVSRVGTGYALDLPASAMEPADLPEIAAATGAPGAPTWASTSEAAEGTIIILLDSEAAVRALEPDFRALAKHHVMAVPTAPGDDADIVSRVFVPAFGIDEDPVTGSAHAALASFWAPRLGRSRFSAVQASRRGGRIECSLEGDRAILGGQCVTVIEGSFLL